MSIPRALMLREDRARLIKQAQGLSLNTSEDRARANRMLSDAESMMEEIRTLERVGPPSGAIDYGEGGEKRDNEKRSRAFTNYLRNGRDALNQEDRTALAPERRDMGSGGGNALQGPGAGFLVPVGMADRIETAMKFYGPMLEAVTQMPTETGAPLPYPTSNDTTVVGELVGEGQQVTEQDVTIGSVIFGAYKYSTKMVKVSVELLQDSAFDIEGFLIDRFGERLGRIVNTHTTIGTGVNQPNGIVTAASLGNTAVGSSSNDGTSAGANTIGSDDLINLEHSVDPLYRRGAAYMMHDSTLRQLKTLKDKYGRPLWLPGLATREPDTINGYAYWINNDMATLQVNAGSPPVTNKTVLYGNLKKHVIRKVREMSVLRLTERYADYGQVAFLGFARLDSQMLDAGTHPVRYLQNVF